MINQIMSLIKLVGYGIKQIASALLALNILILEEAIAEVLKTILKGHKA